MEKKLKIKKEVYDRCLEILEEHAETARQTMNDIQKDANESEQEHDVFDGSRSSLLSKRDIYAKQLKKAVDDIEVLKKVSFEEPKDKVEFGAIVITNKQNMFITLGLGKVKVDKEVFYVISKDVPIYKTMENLKKGDSFHFNNIEYTIKDVF